MEHREERDYLQRAGTCCNPHKISLLPIKLFEAQTVPRFAATITCSATFTSVDERVSFIDTCKGSIPRV